MSAGRPTILSLDRFSIRNTENKKRKSATRKILVARFVLALVRANRADDRERPKSDRK